MLNIDIVMVWKTTVDLCWVLSIQVREHLEMFAVLKGVKEELLESVVAEMVDEVSFHMRNEVC